MKKITSFLAIACFLSCNSTDESTKVNSASTVDSSSQSVTYPFKAGYSSDFEMGDPKNSATILNLLKDWESGDLTPGKKSFADSVEFLISDGSVFKGQKDSVLAVIQKARSTIGTISRQIDAFLPVRSKDQDEEWVCVWCKQIITDKAGKVDSVYLEESWRLNKEGKVNFMLQYARSAPILTKK